MNARKTILATLLGLSSISSIQAQFKISGHSLNVQNRALPYVTIQLSLSDSSQLRYATADSIGYFSFDSLPSATYQLKIFDTMSQAISFRLLSDTIVNLHSNANLDSSLQSIYLVSHKNSFRRLSDRFVYTPDREVSTGLTGLELMRNVPLVSSQNDELSLIGRTGTTILINHKKINIPMNVLIPMLQAMPASNIVSIELITNPGPEFAANTTGGIININLRKNINEGWQGNLRASYEQAAYGTTLSSAYLQYHKRKWSLSLNPMVNSGNNYSKMAENVVYKNGETINMNQRFFRRYMPIGLGGQLDYDVNDKNTLSYNMWFSFVNGKSNTQTQSLYSSITDSYHQNLPQSGNDHYVYNYGNVNFHHLGNAKKDSYLDANIAYNNFYQRRNNNWVIQNQYSTPAWDTIGAYRSHLPEMFLNFSGNLEYVTTIGNGFKTNIGGQASITNTKNQLEYYQLSAPNWNLTDDPDYRYYENYEAAYFKVSKSLGNDWNFSAGLRGENTHYKSENKTNAEAVDTSYFNLFPSFLASFSPNKNHQFSLSFTRKIIRPGFETLYPGRTYTSATVYTENNPFLQPQMSNVFDFSYTLKQHYVFEAMYYHYTNAYSQFYLQDGDNLKQTYFNYGNIDQWLFELSINQDLFSNFWSTNFTPYAILANYKGTRSPIDLSRHYNYIGIQWQNTFYLSKKGHWTGFMFYNLNGKSSNLTYQKQNITNGFSVQLKKTLGDFNFSLFANDIFNGTHHVRYTQYANAMLSSLSEQDFNFPRSISFSVQYNFGNKHLKETSQHGSANSDLRNRL